MNELELKILQTLTQRYLLGSPQTNAVGIAWALTSDPQVKNISVLSNFQAGTPEENAISTLIDQYEIVTPEVIRGTWIYSLAPWYTAMIDAAAKHGTYQHLKRMGEELNAETWKAYQQLNIISE